MSTFEKMVSDDRQEHNGTPELSEATLPDGSTKALGPCTKDAFSVFEDLCLFANSEKPNFLKLGYLHKTFALELIECAHELSRTTQEAHGAFDVATTPPLSTHFEISLRLTRLSADAQMYTSCVPDPETVLIRARDGS
ncbi:hypothetical protein BDR03DRAFT_729831 [Suillus americanus]|nr:hypothetical protein BDR03DRAFT_729831 [Suillus americanus]